MSLSKNITSLISDGTERILQDFLQTTPQKWADEHMQRRYSATPPKDDDPKDHFARLCHAYLMDEYRTLRGWFTEEGKLSRILMSRTIGDVMSSRIGNGIGWDFKPNGEIEPRMIQFKGTLIACTRIGELRPRDPLKLDCGSAAAGGLAKTVRDAYEVRANVHTWTPIEESRGKDKVIVSGGEMSRRWVAYRVYNFLIRAGIEDEHAWVISGCRKVFGEIEPAKGFPS